MFNQEFIRKVVKVSISLFAALIVFLAFAQLSFRWEQKQLGSRYVIVLSDKTIVDGYFYTDWLGDFEVKDARGNVIKSFSADYVQNMVRIGAPAPIADPWRVLTGLLLSLFGATMTYLFMYYVLQRADF